MNRSSSAASVLLPEPDGPTTASRSPSARRTERPRTAAVSSHPASTSPTSRWWRTAGRSGAGGSETAGTIAVRPASRSSAALVRAASDPASARGAATSARASGSSTSSARSGPEASAARPAATTADQGHPGAGGQQDQGPRRGLPARGPQRGAGHLPPGGRDPPGGEVGRLPDRQLGGGLHGLHHPRGQLGPAPHRGRLGARGPGPRQQEGAGAGHQAGERDHHASRRQQHPGGEGRGEGDEHEAADRQPDPQLAVDHGVHVVDHRGEQVATPAAQASRGERHDRVVHRHPAIGEQPQRHVVGAHPLDVPQHRSSQPERPDRDHRDQQGQHRRPGRGLHDQPAGGRGQRHAGRGRRRPHQAAEQQSTPGRRPGVGSGGSSSGGSGGRLRRHGRTARRGRRPCRRGSGGGRRQRQHPVRQLDERRLVGDHDDAAGAAELGDGVGDDELGDLVEVGGRLVEQDPGPVGQHHPGEREPGPLAGGEAGPVLAERLAEAAGQGPDPLLERHPAQGLPEPVVGGVGRRQPEVVGDGAGHEDRPLRQQRHPPPPGRAAHRAAAGGEAPVLGGCSPASTDEQGGLAAAGRSGDHGDPAGGQGRVQVGQRGQRPPGVHHAQPGDDQRPVGGRTRRRPGPRRAPRRSPRTSPRPRRGVELRADAAQRPVGLRGEQQHHQRGVQAEVAGGQPQAHQHGDQRDREGRDQLEHRRGGERQPQRAQGRPPVAVGDLADPPRLGAGPAEGDQHRQPAHHVEEVARQRRQRPPLPRRPVTGGQPDQSAEERQQRKREGDHEGAEQVLGRDRHQRQRRQHGREHQRRQVAGEVRLGGRDPAGGEHRDLAGGSARARRRPAVPHRPARIPARPRGRAPAGRAGGRRRCARPGRPARRPATRPPRGR